MTADEIRVFAPAKVNLALHVTGQRDDGYHLIDTLVAFAGTGDRVTARAADDWSLRVSGPRAAGVPTDATNLILRAARAAGGAPAAFDLDKHLPLQGGIGGGTADAAAALRALHQLDGRPLPDAPERIGADLPVCLAGGPCRVEGIGEIVTPLPPLPPLHAVLVHPGAGAATPAVFAALSHKDNAPLPPPPVWQDTGALCDWLAQQRNDLEAPARLVCPAIGVALSRLQATGGCRLARMSGSGATCFGLYDDAATADAAARALAAAHRDWWVVATTLG